MLFMQSLRALHAACRLTRHAVGMSRPARGVHSGPAATAEGLPVVHHPAYSAPQLPPGHRFPMGVFQCIHDLLLRDGVVQPSQIHVPPSLPSREMLELAHDPDYLERFCNGALDDHAVKRIGFGPVARSPVLVERTLAEIAGTLLTAELALQRGLAVNTAGGTHHAFRAHGSGFCILNDLAVTALELLRRGAVQRVLILDLDVHQGDGTAAILEGHPHVMTVSFHAASNFPARKQRSHLDVPLPDRMEDEAYLGKLGEVLPGLLSDFRPDLVIYDAGIDPHVGDALGKLALTDEGLHRRELLVLDTVLSAGVPLAGVVGGGYHADLGVLAHRHTWLHRAAASMWRDHGL